MNSHTRDIELEERIDAYIRGELTEEQVDELWVELLKKPEYMDLLETEIDLARLYRAGKNSKNKQRRSESIVYWKWVAAAAVALLVVYINFFGSSNDESIREWTQGPINLLDNMASAEITRSDANIPSADSVLNTAFKAAINGDTKEAANIYEMILEQKQDSILRSKASFNLGILQYNAKDYGDSINHLREALAADQSDSLITERAYWYMGNALANIGDFSNARVAIQKAYTMGRIYQEDAFKLQKRLDYELGKIDLDEFKQQTSEIE
jgi:tetratricopeptide (TPR) repeat protein